MDTLLLLPVAYYTFRCLALLNIGCSVTVATNESMLVK